MGSVDDFINSIKLKEGLRFDREVAELVGVDKHTLANAKLRNKLPQSYVIWYCKKYNISIEAFNKEISITKDNTGEEKMHDFAMSLAKDKIQALEMEINELKKRSHLVQNPTKIITTSLWDTIDYDVQTFQTYDSRDFGYFKSYKIIRWQEFFAKLGYHGEEAEIMHQEHLDSMDIKNKNTDKADGYENFLLHHEATDSRLYDRETSNKFFEYERKAQTVSKMNRFNLNYKHKNGSYVPAILHCLFDFDKLTGISKIKFIDMVE